MKATLSKLKSILKSRLSELKSENKAQVSVEFLIILGIIIIAVLLVGYYLKQVSAKNVKKASTAQNNAIGGYH